MLDEWCHWNSFIFLFEVTYLHWTHKSCLQFCGDIPIKTIYSIWTHVQSGLYKRYIALPSEKWCVWGLISLSHMQYGIGSRGEQTHLHAQMYTNTVLIETLQCWGKLYLLESATSCHTRRNKLFLAIKVLTNSQIIVEEFKH